MAINQKATRVCLVMGYQVSGHCHTANVANSLAPDASPEAIPRCRCSTQPEGQQRDCIQVPNDATKDTLPTLSPIDHGVAEKAVLCSRSGQLLPIGEEAAFPALQCRYRCIPLPAGHGVAGIHRTQRGRTARGWSRTDFPPSSFGHNRTIPRKMPKVNVL